MKIDPYKHREKYLNWKEKCKQGIPELNKENFNLLLNYLRDMEIGINVSIESKKGARSFIRLISLRDKLTFIMKKTKEIYNIGNVTEITEEQLLSFFSDMVNGKIKKANGKSYIAVRDYIKIFKAFWHWYQKSKKKERIDIPDITASLDCEQSKPDWVYLTEDQVKKLADNAKHEYKVLIYFLFDTGIRAPTELINVKVSDLINDFKELNIREETSKTFGRRIKLMLCSSLIKEYVKDKTLKPEDYLFPIKPAKTNLYLKRLAKRILGDKESLAGQKYPELTMYDFRHISCCYWLPRYKSESALKYRFGWKKSDKIHYYSELLGMKDTISEDDMLIDLTRTEIEKRLEKSEKEREVITDRLKSVEMELEELKKVAVQLIKVSKDRISIEI